MVRIILGAPVGSTGAVGIHTYAVSYDRPVCQGYIRLQEHRMCHTCRNTALSISSAACDTRTMSAQRRPTPVQGGYHAPSSSAHEVAGGRGGPSTSA